MADRFFTGVSTAGLSSLFPGLSQDRSAALQRLFGDLNPFVQAAVNAYVDVKRPKYGAKTSGDGLLWDTAYAVVLNLPEVKVILGKQSQLEPGRTRQDMIRQSFGDFTKRIDVAKSAEYKARYG